MLRVRSVHAFSDDALGELDAVGIVEAYRGGLRPRDVVEAAIARAELVGASLGAIAHPAWEQARAEAADPGPGYFSGVPTFVKENVTAAGLPISEGSDAFTAASAPEDGDVVRMMRSTGLVVLGSTRMSEFGFSAAVDHPRLGPVRSPWDTGHYAGASSAGAGALVAAGVVPMAHGNDGGGSIRIPASVNGLVGLKPTRGRMPAEPVSRQVPVRIVSDGVLTRTVRDTAAFHREAEKVWRNPELPPVGDITRPGRARLRIGVQTRGIARDCDAETRSLTLRTAERLADLGHHVEEIAPPAGAALADAFLDYWASLAWLVRSTGRRAHPTTWDPERLDPLTHELANRARRRLRHMPGAVARLKASARVARRARATHDVTLSPTLAHATPALGHFDSTLGGAEILERLLDWVAFTPLANVTGEPSISLPLERTASGLPVGMMFSAGHGREARLLALALELEQVQGGFESLRA